MWEYKDYAELYHHGILGMKWGKRNGPPYPLSEADKSAAERRAQSTVNSSKKKTPVQPYEQLTIKRNVSIWGRDFKDFDVTLNGLVSGDTRTTEQLYSAQRSALKRFLSNSSASFTRAKRYVLNYVNDNFADDHAENPKKNNIFSFVMPKEIFVSNDEIPCVGLLCNFKYDPEHGLGIRFYDDGRTPAVGGEGDVGLF